MRKQLRAKKAAEVAAEKKQAEFELALVEVMRSASGRKVLMAILSQTHVLETSQVDGSALTTAFREGERNVGLSLIRDMKKADSATAGEYLAQIGKE